jgi:hypothetical protein
VKSALNDNDLAAIDAVHESVLAIDASRPTTGEVVFQCLPMPAKGED